MNIEALITKFYQLVAPSLPNEWDVEEALTHLATGTGEHIDDIFAQIPAIWPVSHSLCFSYLAAADSVLNSLEVEELSLWVHTLLDRYETSGLHGAQLFMGDVERHFVSHRRGQGGLRLSEVRSRLQPYVNGLAGREMLLIAADCAGTNTECIFLPHKLGLFASNEKNFLLYKLMASFQWASIQAGTFAVPQASFPFHASSAHPLEQIFTNFEFPANARSLYHFFETGRVLSFLQEELPGLMRDAAALLPRLPLSADTALTMNLLDRLQQGLLRGKWPVFGRSETDDRAVSLLRQCQEQGADNQVSLDAVQSLMPTLIHEEELSNTQPIVIQGPLRLQEVLNIQMKRRQERELRFIKALTIHLQQSLPLETLGVEDENGEEMMIASQQGQDLALVVETENQAQSRSHPQPLTSVRIDNQDIPLNEELAELAEQIRQDIGILPDEYVSSAVGKAGQGYSPSQQIVPVDDQGILAPVVYDEWDYRRKGFRKNWCVVTEKEITPVQTSFIEQTLQKYRGQIRKLRHQFELMQTHEHFVRRQRDGNDIDLDALVESLADIHAGRPPSDRLFIRLAREQRDIAVYFLVDLSNSTAGWVGQSIKEALVLICEAMEVLNDRYGIYGFSGMRRLRCELFPIKRLDERYSQAVRQRIGAIGPRDYTRMAPAIRHMTSLFAQVEAKIRLLIVLSDGKPEDYDDYKGEYAIEDTRHALMEAKAKGIHPFCITIDRQAHDYMAHMYGEVNYIFIDEVSRLPARMPEIYRTLTT
jgi:nitric oxide reductase NorD protein